MLKDRYSLVVGSFGWSVDVFLGDNVGLVIAEVEFGDATDVLVPDWCGEEVTGDVRYYNRSLARVPFRNWGS